MSWKGFDKERGLTVFLVLLPALILGARGVGDMVASICALIMLYRGLSEPYQRWFYQPWFGAALLLCAAMIALTSPFALFPLHSLKESLLFIRWPLFALFLCHFVFTRPRHLELFERAALGWMLFIVLDSIFQYVHGSDLLGRTPSQTTRLIGPFTKEVPGIYSLRLYAMALIGLVCWGRQAARHYLLPLVGGFMVLVLVFAMLAGERLVFLQFVLISVVAMAILIYQMRPSRAVIAGLAAMVAGAAVAVAVWAPRMVQRTIVSFGDQLESFHQSNYFKIFKAASLLWQQRPWTGIGTRSYSLGCEKFDLATRLGDAEGCAVHPHNIYIEWMSENGVIGLLLFVLMLWFIGRQVLAGLSFRRDPLLSTLVVAAPFFIFFPLITSMSMLANNYAGIVWLTLAWAMCRRTA